MIGTGPPSPQKKKKKDHVNVMCNNKSMNTC